MHKIKIILGLTLFVLLDTGEVGAQSIWTSRKPMPTPRSGVSAVVYQGQIYVMGGRDRDGRVVDVVERYDPATDTWETDLPRLKRGLENAAAVVFQETMFILGGRDDEGEISKKVAFFDRGRNRWQEIQSMKEEREGLAAAVLGGELFAIGGFGGEEQQGRFLESVEVYDPQKDEWSIATDWELDFARASLATVVVNDSAYSIGGFSSLGPLGIVQRYHLGAGTAPRADLLSPRGGLSAIVSGDTIFVFGGRGANDQVLDSVEFFLPSENRWQPGAPLTLPRENFAAVTVDGVLYIFGGRDEGGDVLDAVEAANSSSLVTSVMPPKTDAGGPSTFLLQQNYPNPFNAGTRIRFEVAGRVSTPTRLIIYNVRGHRIRTLINQVLAPGAYQAIWDGTDEAGAPVASGVYVYQLQNGGNKIARKMTLVR